MTCPKCGSHNIVTDRKADPDDPHTCTDCWRVFSDSAAGLLVRADAPLMTQIGEVLGWRAWNVITTPEGARLQSLGTGGASAGAARHHVWEPGSVEVASCAKHFDHLSPASAEAAHYPHGVPFAMQVPVESCSCGFYSALTREHLMELDSYHLYNPDVPTAPVVIGQVAMSGKVIPGSQGWRAQEMWPHKLFVPHQFWQLVKPLAAAYNCPVELSKTLEKRRRGW